MNQKKIIRFGIKYWISPAFLTLLSIFVLVYGIFFFKDDYFIYKILFYLLIFLCICIFLLLTLLNIQYTVINKEYLEIKSLLCCFCKIKINSIIKIKIESLLTFINSLGSKSYNVWIVFYTDENQITKFGLNRKNKPPYMIPYNEKNIKIVKQFFDKKLTANIIEPKIKNSYKARKVPYKKK